MEANGDESTIDAYQDRFVAYADILGWSSATQNGEIKTLVETLKSIEDYANNFSPLVKEALVTGPGLHSCIVLIDGAWLTARCGYEDTFSTASLGF